MNGDDDDDDECDAQEMSRQPSQQQQQQQHHNLVKVVVPPPPRLDFVLPEGVPPPPSTTTSRSQFHVNVFRQLHSRKQCELVNEKKMSLLEVYEHGNTLLNLNNSTLPAKNDLLSSRVTSA